MPYRRDVGTRRCRNAAYDISGVHAHGHPDADPQAITVTPLSVVTRYLRCPNCRSSLTHGDRVLTCNKGHSFDVPRKGPVALLAPRRKSARGDSAKMVAARETFLASGRYAPIADEISAAAQAAVETSLGRPRVVVDLGAGTGQHLAAAVRALPDAFGIALDASKAALRRAVSAHPELAAVTCDVWHELPLHDTKADLILNAFAPRNGPEIARVLSAHGALIVATPTQRHLHQLVRRLGMLSVSAGKRTHLQAGLSPHFNLVGSRDLEFDMKLDEEAIQMLVAMGPSAHHLNASDVRERLAQPPHGHTTVTVSVVVDTFRPAGQAMP
jgi:23S rRNA (guanine745-N1)-methyltransferase